MVRRPARHPQYGRYPGLRGLILRGTAQSEVTRRTPHPRRPARSATSVKVRYSLRAAAWFCNAEPIIFLFGVPSSVMF